MDTSIARELLAEARQALEALSEYAPEREAIEKIAETVEAILDRIND